MIRRTIFLIVLLSAGFVAQIQAQALGLPWVALPTSSTNPTYLLTWELRMMCIVFSVSAGTSRSMSGRSFSVGWADSIFESIRFLKTYDLRNRCGLPIRSRPAWTGPGLTDT